jgi:hypothetical protein
MHSYFKLLEGAYSFLGFHAAHHFFFWCQCAVPNYRRVKPSPRPYYALRTNNFLLEPSESFLTLASKPYHLAILVIGIEVFGIKFRDSESPITQPYGRHPHFFNTSGTESWPIYFSRLIINNIFKLMKLLDLVAQLI